MIIGKYFHTFEWRKETDREELCWQGQVKDYDPEKGCVYIKPGKKSIRVRASFGR